MDSNTQSDLRSGPKEQSTHTVRDSRVLAVWVNLAKLLVLATAVPAATVGIAQRATELTGVNGEATLVGVVGALGSLMAILGALALGRAADSHGATLRARWLAVLIASLISATGTVWMVFLSSAWELIGSWMVVQFGVAGASAVLRVLLTHALPNQRRRGATAMVIFTYIGAGVPLLVLLFLPLQLWNTAVVFGLLSVLAAVVAVLRRRRRANSLESAGAPITGETTSRGEGEMPYPASGAPSAPREPRTAPPWGLILFAQLVFHIVMAAYLGYHSLDVAARFDQSSEGAWSESTVRVSMLTLMAALAGLLCATGYLLIRPTTAARSLPLLITTGVMLAVSFGMRGLTDSLLVLILAMVISGMTVGFNSSLLLTAALESGPRTSAGGRVGIYSAITAVGQLVGPLAGLAVLWVFGEYQYLYLVLGVIPLTWSAWAMIIYIQRMQK